MPSLVPFMRINCLNQRNIMRLALCAHLLRPQRRLNLADVSLTEEKHTEPRLSNAAADRLRQRAVEKAFVEIELLALLLALDKELTFKGFLIDPHAHRRNLKRATQNAVPQDDVTVETAETLGVGR